MPTVRGVICRFHHRLWIQRHRASRPRRRTGSYPSGLGDGLRRSNERIRRCDDLVPRSNSHRDVGKPQGVRTAIDANTSRCADERRKLRLEACNLGSPNKGRCMEYASDGRYKLLLEGSVLGDEIEKRDGLA